MMEPTFSWSSKTPKTGKASDYNEKLTAEESADAAKYGISKVPAGAPISQEQHRAIQTQIADTRLAFESVNNNRSKPMTPEQEKAAAPYLTDPTVRHAIADGNGIPYDGIQQHLQNADAHIAQAQRDIQTATQKKDQAGLDAANKLLKDASDEKSKLVAFSTVAIDDKQKEAYKAKQEKGEDMMSKAMNDPKLMENNTAAYTGVLTGIKNNPNESPERRQNATDLLAVVGDISRKEIADANAKAEGKKEASKGFTGNPAASGTAFLASLKPEEQSLVSAIGTGKIVLKRLDYLATKQPEVLEAVMKAYPEFDSSKAGSYPGVYEDFTKGKTATELKSGGTAMGHLAELRALNTNASHNIMSPEHTAYENKVDTVATELAKFYGDATIPAIAAIKKTLMTTLPGHREAAITTQAESMGDRLASVENQWKNAAPSPAYEAPIPFISSDQKRAFASLNPKYAAEHPEFAPAKPAVAGAPAAAAAQVAPKGGTHPMISPDGKTKIWALNNKWVTANGQPYKP